MPITEATGVAAVRVVVVHDHELVAHSLGVAIGGERGLEVVATATSVADCLLLTAELRPDVVIMGLELPDGDCVEAARRIRAATPQVNVIMMGDNPEDSGLAEALDAGCCGIVTKRSRFEDLVLAIRAAATGNTTIPRELVDRLMHPTDRQRDHPDLSAREQEVLQLMAAGHSTSTMASELRLSVHTTRNHVRNLMTKLGAHSRLDAVVLAARSGLIELPNRC